jgi:hypothetical protein
MQLSERGRVFWALASLLLLTASTWSQSPQTAIQLMSAAQPNDAAAKDRQQLAATPLAQVLRWAEVLRQRADKINDYSCTFIKRERIDDQLGEHQQMQLRIRHRPFSIYAAYLAPESVKGRRAVWIEGHNGGKLLAAGTGLQSLLGTMSLDPQGSLAMQGNLYPITEIGIRNLADKMLRTTQQDAKLSQADITFRQGAKVGDRSCVCIQLVHPVAKTGLRYHMTRMYVDEELLLPIRFEGYTWPSAAGGDPLLIEEYTYTNLRFNHGFTDRDFQLP